MIRFYSPMMSDDEALDVRVPRQTDRLEAEAIKPDAVVAPDSGSVSAPD